MQARISILAITFLLQLTGCHIMTQDTKSASIDLNPHKQRQHLVGRFSLHLPNTFTTKRSRFVFSNVIVGEEHYTKTTSDKAGKEQRLKQFYMKANELGPRLDGSPWIAKENPARDIGNWAHFIAKQQGMTGKSIVDFNLLVDYDNVFVHYSGPGALAKYDKALAWFSDIAKNFHVYNSHAQVPVGGAFHLMLGYIRLPYDRREETYAEFDYQSQGLTLTFKTLTVYRVEPSTLSERLEAALLTWVIPGFSVDKIHSGKRELDGLKGDELIMRTTEKHRTQIQFMWNYPGKPDSGEHPNIQIEMVTTEGDLKEQRQVWEQVLAGFRRIPGKIE